MNANGQPFVNPSFAFVYLCGNLVESIHLVLITEIWHAVISDVIHDDPSLSFQIMRNAHLRLNSLSCLILACGILCGEINGQDSSPALADKVGEAVLGERLAFIHKALEMIEQGEVRPPIFPETHEAGAKSADKITNLPLKPSSSQQEYSSDLTGIWKMSGWIKLISGQHECLGIYLHCRGKLKLDDKGQAHFTSIWPNAPERTEIFGTLSGGRLMSKEMYGDKLQTMTRRIPRNSPKDDLNQGSEKEVWTETLDRELRAFYHGTEWDNKTTVLTGFWQVKGAEAHLLVTPNGDAWYFQVRDFGRWMVDDKGQVLVKFPNEKRTELYAKFYGNTLIHDQGDYQNIYQKFEPQ